MAQKRSIFQQIINNFINSFKVRHVKGEFKGRDKYGTEYYESITKDKLRPSRWFEPKKEGHVLQEIPVEWKAWLNYTSENPPTEELIQYNLHQMHKTVENSKKFEIHKAKDKQEIKTEKPSFPVYKDYEEHKGFK